MSVTISPAMTVAQIAELIERHTTDRTECYVQIESVNGKPVAILMRRDYVPILLRHQAPGGPP